MSGTSTSDALVRSAELLFARGGVDRTSLRAIARAAGARNVMAVQYHFTDRDGIVQAVLDKHSIAIESHRHRLLDRYERAGIADVRELAAALVRPFAAKLDDPDGGPEFLQVYADLLNRPDPLIERAALEDPGNSMHRWRRAVDPLIDDTAVRLHRRFTAMTVAIFELGRRARVEGRRDHRLFVSTLVDHVAAILSTEASGETRSLLAERTR